MHRIIILLIVLRQPYTAKKIKAEHDKDDMNMIDPCDQVGHVPLIVHEFTRIDASVGTSGSQC